jgi:hypothetical protein
MAFPGSLGAAEVARTALKLFLPVSGLFAWAAQFTLIYGFTAVACARGFADADALGVSVVPLTIILVSAVAFAATGVVLLRAIGERRRMSGNALPSERFLNYTTILVGGLSLVTIAWHGLPALIVPACW